MDIAQLGLVVDADGFVRANQVMAQFNASASSVESSAERIEKRVSGMDRAMQAASKAVGFLTAALGIREIVSYADAWSDLNARLVNATGSHAAADRAMNMISDTAARTYSALQQTADAYLRNSTTLTELGYSTERQLQLADALNNALVVSATKGQAAETVMNALSKSFAGGELRGENFNTVIQQGGRIVEALADGLGVTTLELRALAEDGLLTTGRVVDALTSQMEVLQAEAAAMEHWPL
jgi:tape measure domain-containing protein